ncbi:hypothetical protein J437_LFUL000324 [Ladona fulva]|uniref:ADAMTS/ADAMTS-like Spacer 1 domain-containing protein n=1 Tax=Ladona fulva TaxID=123851 RepID=A0A8K0K2Y6_LADFU|nr:hypothetical protein J437_LFUL000324 [Ladona fulva]
MICLGLHYSWGAEEEGSLGRNSRHTALLVASFLNALRRPFVPFPLCTPRIHTSPQHAESLTSSSYGSVLAWSSPNGHLSFWMPSVVPTPGYERFSTPIPPQIASGTKFSQREQSLGLKPSSIRRIYRRRNGFQRGAIILHVGCDGVIGSEKKIDACGLCGGDNSTCRLVSGLFTRPQLPVGYNLIAQIPRGACNINITELKQSRNYLGE